MNEKIGITRKIPQSGITMLQDKGFQVKVWPEELPAKPNELVDFLKDCQGAITMLSDQMNQEVLAQLPHLKIISNYAVGYNNIDLNAAKEHSIVVTNTPDVLTEATAELSLALLLAVSRKLIPAVKQVEQQQWKTWVPTGFLGMGLQGKTLGIIGPGRIAYAFASKCHKAFDMKVIYAGPHPKNHFDQDLNASYVSLEKLCQQADVISLHCPLNQQTHHLIGKKQLLAMKDNAILINTARGEIIDQTALEEILPHKDFTGIGLDVTTPEPILSNSPLLKDPRVIILPHIGSANTEAREAMSELCAENIVSFFAGHKCPTQVLQ